MEKLLEEHRQLIERINYYEAKMNEGLKECLTEAFAKFFVEFPEVACIHWKQFTPYFNDGDACYFIVHEPVYCLTHSDKTEDDDDYLEEGDYLYDSTDLEAAKALVAESASYHLDKESYLAAYIGIPAYKVRQLEDHTSAAEALSDIESQISLYGSRSDEIRKALDSICGFVESVPDNVMETVFGESVLVRVTAKGFTIEEYYHD